MKTLTFTTEDFVVDALNHAAKIRNDTPAWALSAAINLFEVVVERMAQGDKLQLVMPNGAVSEITIECTDHDHA